MSRTWIVGVLWVAACGGGTSNELGQPGNEAMPNGTTTALPSSGQGAGAALDGSAGALGATLFDDAGTEGDGGAVTVSLGGVTVAPTGLESGALTGYQWAGLAPGATGTIKHNPTSLCMSGTIAPVMCTPNTAVTGISCTFSTDYGVLIGFDTTNPRGAWGAAAPSMLAVTYTGTPGVYDLFAHVDGDPDRQWYGLTNYTSGQLVSPGSLALDYYDATPTMPLSSFQNVDQLAIFLQAEPTIVTYDYCVTGISTQ